jgi:hypothetical protein
VRRRWLVKEEDSGMASEPPRLQATGFVDVDDDVFESLMRDEKDEFRTAALNPDENCPFELAVAAPRAVDVVKLYKLWKRPLPATLEASLGPHFAVMLCQSLTPFYRSGGRPVGVASLGYRIEIEPTGCVIASVFPESKLLKVGTADVKIQLGLNADGGLDVPKTALALASGIPGLSLNGIRIDATTDTHVGVALQCEISFLQVQAGPIGQGGAGWNLYKKGQRIDIAHALVHTLLAPNGTKGLTAKIDTWVREPRRFLKLVRGREWRFPTVEYAVSLERTPLG